MNHDDVETLHSQSHFSVIFNNGTYRSLGNDQYLGLQYDRARFSFILQYNRNGDVINEPVYAANCAYFPDDGEL